MSVFANPPVITDDGDTSWLQPSAPPPPSNAPQNGSGGYWWPSIIGGVLNSIKSGFTLPGDVATGKVSTSDPGFANRVGDMASLAMGGAGLAPAEENALNMGIRAYHGSPHAFDKFSTDAIGTGEGAQAYGHGLYFADNEGVARSYRDNLTTGGKYTYGGQEIDDPTTEVAANIIDRYKGDKERALNYAHYGLPSSLRTAQSKTLADTIEGMDPDQVGYKPNQGHMYEVNIDADPNQFLDWDKPLSEQPHAQQALGGMGVQGATPTPRNGLPLTNGATLRIEDDPDFGRKYFMDMAGGGSFRLNESDLANLIGKQGSEMSGKGAYAALSDGRNPAQISEALNSAGIPGIKYLDAGSRGAGDGSHNYVVFNQDLVNILRRYGLAGLGGAVGLNALSNPPPSPNSGQ